MSPALQFIGAGGAGLIGRALLLFALIAGGTESRAITLSLFSNKALVTA